MAENCLFSGLFSAFGLVRQLVLQPEGGLAIVPAPLTTFEDREQPLDVIPVLSGWIRGGVLIAAVLLTTVFAIAFWLNPYDEAGQARRMETHRQLGLPPCTFKDMTGLPCPSCGMTSSFALLVHGDVMNSLRANAVGTLLALLWAGSIPWLLACGVMGRPWGSALVERGMLGLIITFVALLLLRWFVVLGMIWFGRS
jgi:hypothetical protein